MLNTDFSNVLHMGTGHPITRLTSLNTFHLVMYISPIILILTWKVVQTFWNEKLMHLQNAKPPYSFNINSISQRCYSMEITTWNDMDHAHLLFQ